MNRKASAGRCRDVLGPGKYYEYANPFAFEVKWVDPVQIEPGHRGVVALMTGTKPAKPNDFLVADGERGVQRESEPEGFRLCQSVREAHPADQRSIAAI